MGGSFYSAPWEAPPFAAGCNRASLGGGALAGIGPCNAWARISKLHKESSLLSSRKKGKRTEGKNKKIRNVVRVRYGLF